MRSFIPAAARLFCTFCGAEIAAGEPYWAVNGAVVCEACLPEFARQDYLGCRCVRGREGRHDAS
jgi:hypothetical protein